MSSLKRAFDVVGACAGLLVFAPVMAVVAAAVLIDDGRPVLFRQQRLGYRRRPFSIVKIRTMRDGRITRVGKVTGLAQIVGAPSTDAALELDRRYTVRWNPLLDCCLIALSFAVNVFGKSRVQRRLRRSTVARAESTGRP